MAAANHLMGEVLLAEMIVLSRFEKPLRVAYWLETLNGCTLGRENSRGYNLCETLGVSSFKLWLQDFLLIWLRLLISSLPKL
jgi:hypothetical protein